MRYVRYIGLGLMAAFALGAPAASSASVGELLARVAGGGSAAGVSFSSLGGLSSLFTHSGTKIHCKHVHNHGLFLTSTSGYILIQFLECTANGSPCEGAPGSNEIHVPSETTLFHLGLGQLTLTKERIPAAAILLDKDVKCEGPSGFVKVLVLGAVIGALQLSPSEQPIPLKTPFSTAILNFQQTANGLQHLRLFLLPGGELATYDLYSLSNKEPEALLSSEVSLDLLDLFTLGNGNHIELELVEP
jgi:hypothetical protein